ncbi:hypothetical protein M0R45_006082 [Rubus argutus]|uniref:Uncharacterized protein n=1 Tax=Rubus argutus TaxID=59490 RepID=A0AAW1YPG6_RUBAR
MVSGVSNGGGVTGGGVDSSTRLGSGREQTAAAGFIGGFGDRERGQRTRAATIWHGGGDVVCSGDGCREWVEVERSGNLIGLLPDLLEMDTGFVVI